MKLTVASKHFFLSKYSLMINCNAAKYLKIFIATNVNILHHELRSVHKSFVEMEKLHCQEKRAILLPFSFIKQTSLIPLCSIVCVCTCVNIYQ